MPKRQVIDLADSSAQHAQPIMMVREEPDYVLPKKSAKKGRVSRVNPTKSVSWADVQVKQEPDSMSCYGKAIGYDGPEAAVEHAVWEAQSSGPVPTIGKKPRKPRAKPVSQGNECYDCCPKVSDYFIPICLIVGGSALLWYGVRKCAVEVAAESSTVISA